MLIYKILNAVKKLYDYVCDSQATIDAAPENIKPFCVIGNQADADALLLVNQTAVLNQKASLFSVNLEIPVEGGTKWELVDLSTELPNTTNQYYVLNPVTGLYSGAVGLDAAKALLNQTHQDYLVFINTANYVIMDTWILPPPVMQ
jgi:hypothetical protein